ncbi:hypothetical protein L1987_19294 [Smallanthus sonchifolius]|uniref:Uncharacterized protein n=1 Tax=Smallanthus sonchifolius TaxID=185202 RepID=A0ACB9IQB5_9ASTR|nr:hypothetical protein L1987_19294 [Smallanthus sonchifolius]
MRIETFDDLMCCGRVDANQKFSETSRIGKMGTESKRSMLLYLGYCGPDPDEKLLCPMSLFLFYYPLSISSITQVT